MKKIFYFAVAAVATLFASCNIEQDLDIDTNGGKGLDFVHFEEPSVTAVLTDSTCTYEVSLLSVSKSDKARTYEVKVGEGSTGVEGVDFSFESKTITIPAGEYGGSTTVTCNYETVAEAGFVLNVEVVAAEGVKFSPAYGNTMTFNFKTDKVTIDWEWLLGDWNETDYNFNGGVDYQSVAKIVKGENENEIIIKDFYETCDLVGTVDFEARTITFEPQFMLHYDDTYGDFWFMAFDYDTDEGVIEGPVVATMSAAGISTGQWTCFGVDSSVFLGYQLKTTFTR
jgi:hypothetical protein